MHKLKKSRELFMYTNKIIKHFYVEIIRTIRTNVTKINVFKFIRFVF